MGSMSWRTDQGQCGQVTVSGVHTGPAATARNSSDAEKLRTVPDNKKTGMLHNGLWHFVARQWCDPLKDHFKGDVQQGVPMRSCFHFLRFPTSRKRDAPCTSPSCT